MSGIVVTGISTDIGKTITSAVVCEALHADYWKPVQSGGLDQLDSSFVQMHTSKTTIISEVKLLSQPLSPHEAARIDGIQLEPSDFELPHFIKTTVIEGAGGLMVPINDHGLTYLDVFQQWNLPVYLVTRHYLGSINHTLLSLEALKNRGLEIAGLIVSGERNEPSERIYRAHHPEIQLSFIPEMETLSPFTIAEAAKIWKEQVG
jgi:dethiobiotin synthetase